MKIDFIAIDVETAIGKRWSICQIGISIVENGIVTSTISELVQPPNNEYSHWNTRIHGITSEMTENKPLFPEVWKRIYPLIYSKKIVAHNASFDISCLEQALEYYEIQLPHFDYDCTYQMSGQKLVDACCAYNISLESHHNAGCDAEACAKLYLKLINEEQPDLTKVKPKKRKKEIIEFTGHETLTGKVLQPDLSRANPKSPFYDKKVVFTGLLESMKRAEAAKVAKNMGADVDTGITKKTDYVIMGSNPGASKMNKIIKYNNEGSDIIIMYEKEFIKIINSH